MSQQDLSLQQSSRSRFEEKRSGGVIRPGKKERAEGYINMYIASGVTSSFQSELARTTYVSALTPSDAQSYELQRSYVICIECGQLRHMKRDYPMLIDNDVSPVNEQSHMETQEDSESEE
ncbi:hypothetical protein Sjap_015557 [Stephania japonica]|uniref:Uncharacterized protein n=1 Tax=Stephania japonica TaxID=461633 RepID=A0AAP0IK51_9MAGN